MARHRRKRSYHGRSRRRSRGFGFISPGQLLRENVSLKDAALGGAVGLAGGLGALYALNTINATRAANKQAAIGFTTDATTGNPVPAMWMPLLPAFGGVILGVAGYMATKRNKRKAVAILGGSILGGLLVSGFQFAKNKWSTQFGDYVRVRLAGYGNVLVRQDALGNLLVSTPMTRAAGPGQFPGQRSTQPMPRTSMGQLGMLAMSPAARATGGYLRIRN